MDVNVGDKNTTSRIVVEGDCFLLPGDKCRTLYYITEARDNKCEALSIFIDQNTVRALAYADEYALELPDDIIMLPSSIYDAIKQLMLDCVDDMHKVLWNEALDIDFGLEPGALYTDGANIYRVLEMKDGRWYYDIFRIGEDFIVNNWSGDTSKDASASGLKPITEATLDKVQKRFDDLLYSINQLIGQ